MAVFKLSRPLKLAAVCSALAILAGCGPTNTRSLPLKNENAFSVRSTEGVLTGHFNPAGLSSQEVKRATRFVCENRKLASYGETPDDGLIFFEAKCAGAPKEDNNRFTFTVHKGEPKNTKAIGPLYDGDLVLQYVFSDAAGNLVLATDRYPKGKW